MLLLIALYIEIYASETAVGFAVDSAAASSFRKAGLKAARKVITRYAGLFGAAVMLAEFAYCMAN